MLYFQTNLRFLGQNGFLSDGVCPEIPAGRKESLWDGTEFPKPSELLSISEHFGISTDRLLKVNIAEAARLKQTIKLVIFDVDGVLTDGGMYYTESGDEFKKFNAKDGLAIRRLTQEGFITGIISHGINRNLIERRAALLNISKVYTGNKPKSEVLSDWCSELGITPKESAFIGDDLNDLSLIRIVGFSGCPADACLEVKSVVNVVLTKKGGEGCVREWIDAYFQQA